MFALGLPFCHSLFRIFPLCHCRFVAARHEKTDTIQSPLVFFSEESRCDNDNLCNRGTQLPTNSVAAIVRPGPSWMHKALFALCQLCTLAQTLDVARRLDSRSRHSQANCSPKSGNWALLDVTFDEPGKYSLKGWSFCCIDVLNLCWVKAWSQRKFKSGWSLLQEIMGLHAKGPKQETLEVPPPL